MPHQGLRTQSTLLFTHSWRENNWIHTFPKGISAMWNAISPEFELVSPCPIPTTITITPRALLWPSTLCLSRSPDAQPEVLGSTLLGTGFLYCILSATSLVPKLHRGSRGPLRPGVAFSTTSRLSPSPTLTPTVLTSVLTELYNSSTFTRSLKSHVWSSSSGNNCHAVHRSLSSGASVYECTMGIFYLVPFHQAISAHTISSHNCH